VLRNALTLTILDDYHDFAKVAGASLGMVASARGVDLTSADRAAVSTAMINLPPHADMPPSLDRLAASGLQLVALTNSPPEVATAQLTNAGLAPMFDHILSVHMAQRLKPHPEVYRQAAAAIGIPLGQQMMVAAHDWDIAGAMATGMAGAYLTRPGMAVNPLFEDPTLVESTMTAMADAIIEHVAGAES
jgi:2-haloacid dehalogenase